MVKHQLLPLVFIPFLWVIVGFNASKPHHPNATALNKQLVPLEKNLLISKYECSNAWYNLFLTDLQKQGRLQEFETYQCDTLCWQTTFPRAMVKPLAGIYHTHPAYSNYPVVGISYTAANAFCNWLTVWYAGQKNRKYKHITFRLPTEKEWQAAALPGTDSLYPWKGKELRNSRGGWMANFKVADTNWMDDGALFQAEVGSYYPSKTGCYNLAGNVSEMLSREGLHKGGGWASAASSLGIFAADEYAGITAPHPCIGFRFVGVID